MPKPGDAAHRDLHCACCDKRLYNPADMRLLVPDTLVSQHHRVLGNRSDRRLSVLILLYGSGTRECHAMWHGKQRAEAERRGYIIRHGIWSPTPAQVPVWYWQPSLGRVGWHLIDDAGNFTYIDADHKAHALDIAERTTIDD
jgi:hypothetical protein